MTDNSTVIGSELSYNAIREHQCLAGRKPVLITIVDVAIIDVAIIDVAIIDVAIIDAIGFGCILVLSIWRNAVDLSLIPPQPKPGVINVLIEIPAGSKNKYEFDKDLNAFALDRVLYSSVQYPYDYGFVPNTLADDGDPLDGMVLIDQPTFPGCVIAARPIGMLEMVDGGDRDEKILCVPDKDPRYAEVKSLKDVAPHRLEEIAEFFRSYKNLEKKVTEILGWKDVEEVAALIDTCIAAAKK